MDRLHYHLPTEVFAGPGCVREKASAWCLGRKALIVTGAMSAQRSGALEDVRVALMTQNVPYAHFDGVGENPDVEQVYAGVAVAEQEGADFIVAVGGGSPMDAAKSIAWVVGAKIPRARFFTDKPQRDDCVLPIIAVPLTCGTGSEVTPYSIITNHEIRSKANISGPGFFPRVALLDARYLESLPKHVLCDTALDALSHAIEGVYSPKCDALAEAMGLEAIRILVPEMVRLAHDNFVNLAEVQYASMLAGMVIAQTGTGLVHAMGYPLTYYRHLPHGRANGILLAGYLDFMNAPCPQLTERILGAMAFKDSCDLQGLVDTLLDVAGCDRAAPSEEELVQFMREPLRLEVVRRYRAMPSPEEVMDIYRTGF